MLTGEQLLARLPLSIENQVMAPGIFIKRDD